MPAAFKSPPHCFVFLLGWIVLFCSRADMAPFYSTLVSTFGWEEDTTFLSTLKSKNELELVKLADKLADAEKNLGEMEG